MYTGMSIYTQSLYSPIDNSERQGDTPAPHNEQKVLCVCVCVYVLYTQSTLLHWSDSIQHKRHRSTTRPNLSLSLSLEFFFPFFFWLFVSVTASMLSHTLLTLAIYVSCYYIYLSPVTAKEEMMMISHEIVRDFILRNYLFFSSIDMPSVLTYILFSFRVI